ncbi:Rossmann-like and DUF2520 domain-containing protein [Solimicrobium silvestre]|uniref:DUF2520 domain-containing protein n=1 Tax=Solimicrobium silvestre TaxID=2099400 RepID=A0A2S9H197_9BURK|nr:Rossmann-like and DUF2520 domain-containing protein [Solimicrobium silvestre]PRC93738.1 hypothetical protein S2091_1739 [Solimicrobium silvestre]
MKPTLSIIGAGKVGRVLGQQFFKHHIFTLHDVLNRSLSSSLAACKFMGAGNAISEFSELRQADVYMLAVSDDQIKSCSQQLQQLGLINPDTLVFHCSGALCASELGMTNGAASLHPIRSFADPTTVAAQFTDTICSVEGNANAAQILTTALEKMGAQVVHLEPEGKALYHAAAVFASNYLVTLMDAALTTFQAAGIPLKMAQHMTEPLARETLENVFRLGAKNALTGPIARGDFLTVKRHHDALNSTNPDNAELYMALAESTKQMKDRDA